MRVDVHTSPGGAPSMKEDASSTVDAMSKESRHREHRSLLVEANTGILSRGERQGRADRGGKLENQFGDGGEEQKKHVVYAQNTKTTSTTETSPTWVTPKKQTQWTSSTSKFKIGNIGESGISLQNAKQAIVYFSCQESPTPR